MSCRWTCRFLLVGLVGWIATSGWADPPRLPAEIVAELDKLQSDKTDVFLAARRKVLAHGAACKPIVAEQLQKLSPQADKVRWMRLKTLLEELQAQEPLDDVVRVCEAALLRLAAIEKQRDPKATSRVTVLVSRGITGRLDSHPASNVYAGLCYFSFSKDDHGYEGAVSLEFGNGGDVFQVLMYGGQKNRIKSLGAVDFAAIKKAPNAKTTETWGGRNRMLDLKAEAGHVFIEHCLESGDVDLTVKFKVLEVKPEQYVVIEWEPIPQEK